MPRRVQPQLGQLVKETLTAVKAPGVAAGVATNEPKAGKALRHEMPHHHPRGLGIGKAHHMAKGLCGQIPGFDHRNPCVFEELSRAGRMRAAGDHNRLRAAAQKLRDQPLLLVHVVIRIAQQHLQPGVPQGCGHRAHGFGKVGIVDRGDGHRQKPGLLRAQVRGGAVEDIAQILGGFEDPRPGFGIDRGIALERPRHGHRRDSGTLGHIAHRG